MALRDPNRFFDLRTFSRHIRSGRISREQYQEFVKALPDVAENIMDPNEGGDPNDGFENRQGETDEQQQQQQQQQQPPTS